jgi:site-specific recombinase XerD
MVTLKGTNYLYVQGKGHDDKDDAIKVPDSVWELIHEYLEKRDSDSEALFINHGSHNCHGRISPKNVSLSVKNLLRLIGLDDKRYTAHSLRHTCATIALQNGATFQEVQMVLRHKSINTTTIYTHNLSRESNNVELIVEKAIDKKR